MLEHLVEHGIDERTLPALRKLQSKEMEACKAKAPPPPRPPAASAVSGTGATAMPGALETAAGVWLSASHKPSAPGSLVMPYLRHGTA
jgi:hypothetical protein